MNPAGRALHTVRRAIARWQTWWIRLFVLTILVDLTLGIPFPYDLALLLTMILLALVRPPRSTADTLELAAPVRGTWIAINSPGSSTPSHGVMSNGQMYAVDLLQPSPEAPTSLGWALRGRQPESYRCFGQPVRAMAAGTVVRARSRQRDHRARSSWPLVIWMMTAEAFLRELGGTSSLLGNHVIVEHEDGSFAAYAHIRRGSAAVTEGDGVEVGQQLAEVGNTGNTSEPHLHVQMMDRAIPAAAAGMPMRWPNLRFDPEDLDPRWGNGQRKPSALPSFPANGQVFEARERTAGPSTRGTVAA